VASCSRFGELVVVKTLQYKSEGRGFEIRRGRSVLSAHPILPASIGPWLYSGTNRNEHQKEITNISGIRALSVRDNQKVTAICEPIV
jgi:hypothetical protein